MKKGIRMTSVLVVFTLLLLLGVRWAERDGRLNLQAARIDNSSLVDSAVVAEILRPCFGVSLLKLDTDDLEKSLIEIDGVDSAFVKVRYPDTIIVSLVTREPAVILDYGNASIPVTVSGDHLPMQWGNDSLPVICILGEPEEESIIAALELLEGMDCGTPASIRVSFNRITVTENGVEIVLEPEHAQESWARWNRIRPMITDRTIEVDLRYTDQAILRSTEET